MNNERAPRRSNLMQSDHQPIPALIGSRNGVHVTWSCSHICVWWNCQIMWTNEFLNVTTKRNRSIPFSLLASCRIPEWWMWNSWLINSHSVSSAGRFHESGISMGNLSCRIYNHSPAALCIGITQTYTCIQGIEFWRDMRKICDHCARSSWVLWIRGTPPVPDCMVTCCLHFHW